METISSIFLKGKDESIRDYIDRVCQARLEHKITWTELAEIINTQCEFERGFDESYYRKGYYTHRFDNDSPTNGESRTETPSSASTTEAKLQDLLFKIKCEKVKLSDERTQNNAYIRRLSREETLREMAHDICESMSAKKFLNVNFNSIQNNYEKEAILCVSDWHYGIECNSYWNVYNPEVAVSRISTLVEETKRRCRENKISKIHVVNLADLICGRIHLALRLESRMDVITQIIDVSEILAEMLTSFSEDMEVEYYNCTDNHSRIEPNKSDSLELETLARLTPWYLKSRLQNSRIRINDNTYGDDIIAFDCVGHRVLGVHGDKDKPATVVDSLSMMTRERPDLIVTAHMHHFSAEEKNEVVVVGNGSLMGTDSYAKSLRLCSKPSQNLIIVSRDNAIDTLYRIVV